MVGGGITVSTNHVAGTDLGRRLSPTDQLDLEAAISMLKDYGAREIYLFGSMARGVADEQSDWDFAVRGLPSDRYFAVLGELLTRLHRRCDLVDLQKSTRFGEMLERAGEMVRVA
jgi:predicted nucleotidyltransferase